MKCFCRYAIKFEVRRLPVSIFIDPVLSGQFLKSRGWPLYTGSTVIGDFVFLVTFLLFWTLVTFGISSLRGSLLYFRGGGGCYILSPFGQLKTIYKVETTDLFYEIKDGNS